MDIMTLQTEVMWDIESCLVQSWPKVFRITQILIYTMFAASVSLDIFVRCYYGILKYNYKHFISVKGFY